MPIHVSGTPFLLTAHSRGVAMSSSPTSLTPPPMSPLSTMSTSSSQSPRFGRTASISPVSLTQSQSSYPHSANPSPTYTSPIMDINTFMEMSPSPTGNSLKKGGMSSSSVNKKNRLGKNIRPRKNAKKAKRGLVYLKLNLKDSVESGLLNPFNKVQLSILNTGLIKINDEICHASGIIPIKPFDLSRTKFEKHLQLFNQYKVLLNIEFLMATKGENHSTKHATKEENECKNVKYRTVPYDYNRVVLETLPGIPDSDYINASYIDSLLKPSAYIAAQGPMDDTKSDFWRMVWEQKCHIIVMLTKVFDLVRSMCTKYWPDELDKPEYHAPMEVTLLGEEKLAEFTMRKFRLRRRFSVKNDNLIEKAMKLKISDGDDEGRIVYQFQFFSWPIHSWPSVDSLLHFRRRIRVMMEQVAHVCEKPGPVIVHCSDGCGRTGAYLAIDANLEYAEEDNKYDIFGFTKSARNQRKGMIETMDQYKFVYELLLEANINGQTWFPVTELPEQIKKKSAKDPISHINEYQREYEKIVKMSPVFTIGDCAGGHRVENRNKNRDFATIPPDNHRAYLSTFQSNDSTDYVNAVFLDGYTRSKEYVITEWPMPHTIPDCWSLIYDHDCNSVVVLASPLDKSNNPPFWPTEKDKRRKYGPVFTVDCISYNHYANIKSWILRINKKVVSLTELMSGVKGVPKTTQIFQITCWPDGHKVPSSTNALVEMMNMVERWRQRSTFGPVCVISTNGKSRAGVYCAANVAIEQCVQHDEVDVFHAVKMIRRHRPVLIENMTEYKYCYDLVLHYVIHYLNAGGEGVI